MQAVKALSALAQETRLAIFRLLVRRGPGGVAAGEVAVQLDVAPNTLSFHFRTLVEAGLVRATQEGRFVHYAADIPAMLELLDFLTAECCEEDPSCCASMRDGARVAPLLRPLAEAAGAGATVVRPPHDTFWGGYSGYFADPDGHLWEVAHNPFWTVTADGVVRLA